MNRIPRKVTRTDIYKAILEPSAMIRGRVSLAAAKAEAKLDAIDPKLQDRFRREAERATRADFAAATLEDTRELARMAAVITEQRPFFTPAHVRALARFDADPLKNAALASYWFRVLELAGPVELQEIARHATSEGVLALAVAVEREAARRGGGDAFAETIALARSCPLPETEITIGKELDREAREIALAQTIHLETSSGKARTADKVAIAYAAGPSPETDEGGDVAA